MSVSGFVELYYLIFVLNGECWQSIFSTNVLGRKKNIICLGKSVKSTMNKIRFNIIHVISPLVVGASVYVFFRTAPIIGIGFTCSSSLSSYMNNCVLIQHITGSLPDFCWLYALLSLQSGPIWGQYKNIPKIILFFLYIVPPLTEVLQYVHLISGIADFLDFVAYLFAIIIHYFIHKNQEYAS
jgi:hypothetical protein